MIQLPTAAVTSLASDISRFLTEGGLFMIPLFLTSTIGVSVICYKALSLRSARILPPHLALKLRRLTPATAVSDITPLLPELQAGKSSLARLAHTATTAQGQSEAEITRLVESSAREEILDLHSGILMLDVIITVAPLLGLLGTSTALVTIFKGLGETSDHVAIARGIAEALKSTIFGLAIAVPSIFAHSYFSRRIEAHTVRLEGILAHLAHTLKGNPNSPTP